MAGCQNVAERLGLYLALQLAVSAAFLLYSAEHLAAAGLLLAREFLGL